MRMTERSIRKAMEKPMDGELCNLCGRLCYTPDGLDPTPICNLCAQDAVVFLLRKLEAYALLRKGPF